MLKFCKEKALFTPITAWTFMIHCICLQYTAFNESSQG